MRSYKVPADLHGEEKIIGGVASIRQTAYIVVSFLIGLLFVCLIPVSIMNKVGLLALFVIPGAFLGFAKVQGMNVDQFMILYIKYQRRRKVFMYERRRRVW